GIDLIQSRRVAGIDTAGRRVLFDDGSDISYGALLLATGAEPRKLPVQGGDLGHVYYLRTIGDSEEIMSRLGGVSRVAIVGAGFIGLEVAASLRHREIEVTVIAPEEIPLAAIIGDEKGRFVADLHREHGVDFRLGRGAERTTETSVQLADGTTVDADLVVGGIGVMPRTELAEEAGLDVDNGVIVDERLRTSDPHIWAAGDIASYPDPGGSRARVEHWVHA